MRFGAIAVAVLTVSLSAFAADPIARRKLNAAYLFGRSVVNHHLDSWPNNECFPVDGCSVFVP